MRLLPKWIQAVSKNISADASIRPMLAGVHITNTHIGATNSFIAIRAELNPKYTSEKFPGMGIDKIPDEGIIVPSKLLDDIKFKSHKTYDVVDNKAVIKDITDDSITISTTDLDNEISYKSRLIKGKMPDLESFHKEIFQSEKKEEIAFSIEYMQDMLNTFKAMGHDSLILSTHAKNGIVLKPYDMNSDTWGLVMPLKLNK